MININKENMVHKTAEVDKRVLIREGTKVWQNSQIKEGAEIGRDCTIGHNCFIDSGARIGNGVKLESNIDIWNKVTLQDYVFVGPSAVFTNDSNPRARYPKEKYSDYGSWQPTLVKEGASIGANATIICGVTIGQNAFIGAGSVIREDVPDYALVVGVPAKQIGWICSCGNRINFEGKNGECLICAKRYIKENGKVKPKKEE
jgi:UDP-2-acetamido-3-amino-2,3-dideoxy-glucuronate N-acetyltransferase